MVQMRLFGWWFVVAGAMLFLVDWLLPQTTLWVCRGWTTAPMMSVSDVSVPLLLTRVLPAVLVLSGLVFLLIAGTRHRRG